MPTRFLILLAMCSLLAACAHHSSSPDVYSRSQARKPYTTQFGEVTGVRTVKIEGEATWVGGWGGYIVGTAVAGQATNSAVGAAVGGIAGAVAGQAVEKAATGETGLEVEVMLDNGNLLTVVQSEAIHFKPGDKVKVLRRGNHEARVQRRY
jgi:outer membrane lipoprotein SlyB